MTILLHHQTFGWAKIKDGVLYESVTPENNRSWNPVAEVVEKTTPELVNQFLSYGYSEMDHSIIAGQ